MSWIQTTQTIFHQAVRCLLVIAHPDDEVMFFSPLLEALERNGCTIYILCLSTGNFEGLGETRVEELYASAWLHKIPREQVTVVDHPKLQDGMETVWPMDIVSRLVQDHINLVNCNVVFTFDEGGVSGHVNHVATYHGVKHATLTLRRHSSLCAYKLKSKNTLRKFLGVWDVFPSLCLDEHIVFGWQLLKTISGMQAHASQNLWYRQIFICLSSFTYVNSFEEIESTIY